MTFDKKIMAVKFQEFIHFNQEQIGFFENARDYLKSLKNENTISISDLTEKKFPWSEDKFEKIKDLYSRIGVDAPIVLETLNELIEYLKKEAEDMKSFFQNLDYEDIQSLKQFSDAAIRYNEKENVLLKKLQIKAPEILKLESVVFGVQEDAYREQTQIFKKSAKNFVQFYAQVYALIQNKSNKEAVFNALISTLKYLEQYVKQGNTINQNFAKGFVVASNEVISGNYKVDFKDNYNLNINEKYFKKGLDLFLGNFFNANAAIGISTVNELNSFLSKLDYQSGRIQKQYSEANEDDKLDKFLKNTLERLFTEVKFKDSSNKEFKIKDLAIKISKVDDKFKSIEDSFKELYETLQRTKFVTDMSFKTGFTYDNILIFVNGMEKELTIKEFKKEYLKEEMIDVVKSANIYLAALIDSDKKKDPFKSFKKRQEDAGILNGKSTSDGDDDELWENIEKLSDSNVLGAFSEGIEEISNNLIALETILSEEVNYENDSLIESALSSIKDTREHIVIILKSFGKNLDNYFSKKMWSSTNLDDTRKDIKVLIERWNKISTKSEIEYRINDTKSLISILDK